MNHDLSVLSDEALVSATKTHLRRANELDAELLRLLAEIDSRRLFLKRAYSSMHAFCTGELGLSEDAAGNRITVARLAQRLPLVLEFLRTGRVHQTGLRLLAPVLTSENADAVL